MNTKKIVALLLALVMVFALAACGGSGDDVYTIGVCQLMAHPSLDSATQGFKDALIAELGEGKVKFLDQDAGGDFTNCGTIMDGFVAENVDMILANATAPLQAAQSATNKIPVMGTSVTDYASALGIENWTGTVGGNISGTTDLAPLDQQAAMIQELFPDAKTVGMLYCSSEPNSIYQVEVVTGHLTGMGYTVENYPFTDANDLASVTQTACDNVDVIYVPTDNVAATYPETIANVVLPAKIPVITGDSSTCAACFCIT